MYFTFSFCSSRSESWNHFHFRILSLGSCILLSVPFSEGSTDNPHAPIVFSLQEAEFCVLPRIFSYFVVHIQEAELYIYLMYCREACRYPHPDNLNRPASSFVESLTPYQGHMISNSWRDKTLQATVSRRRWGQVFYTGDPMGYAAESPLRLHGAAYAIKNVSVVSNQTLPGREWLNYSRPGRVCLVTFRLGTGKSLTFFYIVTNTHTPRQPQLFSWSVHH